MTDTATKTEERRLPRVKPATVWRNSAGLGASTSASGAAPACASAAPGKASAAPAVIRVLRCIGFIAPESR